MEVWICILIAYLWVGIAGVIRDFGKEPECRPSYTFRPKIVFIIFVILSWFIRPPTGYENNKSVKIRKYILEIFRNSVSLILSSVIIYLCYKISGHIIDNFIAQTVIAIVLIYISLIFIMPLLMPLIMVIMMPITIILGFVMDIVVPIRSNKG